jgi:telomerase reverse transcriptase
MVVIINSVVSANSRYTLHSFNGRKGQPLSELRTLSVAETPGKANPAGKQEIDRREQITQPRTASEIVFVRNRMLYGKAALNSRGEVKSGLLHIRMSLISS